MLAMFRCCGRFCSAGPRRGSAPRAALLLCVQPPEQSLAILFSDPRFVMGTLGHPLKPRVLKETEEAHNKGQVQSDELLGYAVGNQWLMPGHKISENSSLSIIAKKQVGRNLEQFGCRQ